MDAKLILLIEDDAPLREAITALLEAAGYLVLGVATAEAGLVRLFAPDPPALVVLDLILPMMSGFEFIKVWRRVPRLREIPLLVVSAYCDPRAVVGLEPRITALGKPFPLEQFLAQVEASLVGSEW